jgi:hypothetical protein
VVVNSGRLNGFAQAKITSYRLSESGLVHRAPGRSSVRTVVRALAEAGRTAGMGLYIKDAQVVFFHRWRLVKAVKPLGH